MRMADSLFSVVLLAVFFGSAAGNETIVFPRKVHGSWSLKPRKAAPAICTSVIEKKGYTCEEHLVTTSDGYILSVQRIPSGKSDKKSVTGLPVLLVHGVLMDGVIWTILPVEQSLPFILANNGFDVWILNTRGTKPSRKTQFVKTNREYWDWSWVELAKHDLPKTANYVHDKTGHKPHFIGHSTATLSALAGLAKYNLRDDVKSFVLLSPIAYLGHITSRLARFVAYTRNAETRRWLSLNKFNPGGLVLHAFFQYLCRTSDINCRNLFNQYTGPNCCIEPSVMRAFVEYKAQSTSTKNIAHLSQMIRKGTIAEYSYGGKAKNMKEYDKPFPEAYNLSNIPNDVPLYFIHGGKDALSDERDLRILFYIDLKLHKQLEVLKVNKYAQADFILGGNAREVVYDHIVNYLKKH